MRDVFFKWITQSTMLAVTGGFLGGLFADLLAFSKFSECYWVNETKPRNKVSNISI